MTKQELCLLTFSRYYRYIQQNENLIYPDLLSVDNLNQIPRIHLTRKICPKKNVSIDREVHFNNNSVRINYFFSGDAITSYNAFVERHFPNQNDIFFGTIRKNTYKFSKDDTASIECHVKFNLNGMRRPDPDSPSVLVLEPGFLLNDLVFGAQAYEYVDEIIARWKEMIDDIENNW